MKNRIYRIPDILEPFLLGLSVISGGDQFYVLLSHTDVSIRAQSVILFTIAILTAIGSVLIDSRSDLLLNMVHLFYVYLCIYIMLFVAVEIKSLFPITLLSISLGYVLSIIVIHSCSFYCNSRIKLLYFLLGLFTSRSIPRFAWSLVDSSNSHKQQLRSVSSILAFCRFISVLISFFIKLFTGGFKIPIKLKIGKIINVSKTIIQLFTNLFKNQYPDTDGKISFDRLYEIFISWIHFENPTQSITPEYVKYFAYLHPFLKTFPFLTLVSSLVMYLVFPPTLRFLYSTYSPILLSSMYRIKSLSHLFGSLLGICYPASNTGNHYRFYFITILIYIIYVIFSLSFDAIAITLSISVIYFICMASGVFPGYMWSYSLGILINTYFNQTCIYEEDERFMAKDNKIFKTIRTRPCCGEIFNSECYCRHFYIFRELNIGRHPKPKKPIGYHGEIYRDTKRFDCSKPFGKDTNFVYSEKGELAIIILCNGSSVPENCKKICNCENECCQQCSKGKCIKLLAIYKLECVTTSNCDMCQLTVRLEAKKLCCCCCENSGSSGSNCCISLNSNCKCCCLSVGCCNTGCGCSQKCNCCKLCCCKNSCCSNCQCKDKKNGVRVFMCYCNNGQKSCLKELKPTRPFDFDGDFMTKNEFDIRDIFLTSCCHSDLRVDLGCTLKNNFFRMGGINYPIKFDKPEAISLRYKNIKCCKDKSKQCCCRYHKITKLALLHMIETPWADVLSEDSCTGTQKPDCSNYYLLPVEKHGLFYKRFDQARIKLVVFCWFLFGLIFFIIVLLLGTISESKSGHYVFKPKISYKNLVKTNDKYNINSEKLILDRLQPYFEVLRGGDFTVANQDKKKQIDGMFVALKNHMDSKDFAKLTNSLVYISNSFVSNIKKVEYKKVDVSIYVWSHCVGMIYCYAMYFYEELLKFFATWEELWKYEYENYKKLVSKNFNKIGLKSKIPTTNVNHIQTSEQKRNTNDIILLNTWKNLLTEMKTFSNVNKTEKSVCNESLSTRLCERLEQFVDRWEHRLYHIQHWDDKRTVIFDWTKFMKEYMQIRKWVDEISPYMKLVSDIEIPRNVINKGAKIFIDIKTN